MDDKIKKRLLITALLGGGGAAVGGVLGSLIGDDDDSSARYRNLGMIAGGLTGGGIGYTAAQKAEPPVSSTWTQRHKLLALAGILTGAATAGGVGARYAPNIIAKLLRAGAKGVNKVPRAMQVGETISAGLKGSKSSGGIKNAIKNILNNIKTQTPRGRTGTYNKAWKKVYKLEPSMPEGLSKHQQDKFMSRSGVKMSPFNVQDASKSFSNPTIQDKLLVSIRRKLNHAATIVENTDRSTNKFLRDMKNGKLVSPGTIEKGWNKFLNNRALFGAGTAAVVSSPSAYDAVNSE